MKLTQKRLKEVLKYDKSTGVFVRKESCRNGFVMAGEIAGTIRSTGYVFIKIDGGGYLAHRLAWLYVYGYFPESGVDHIDRNPSNNAITNLRCVSQSCNLRNTGNAKNSKSGVKGVRLRKSKKWKAEIRNNYRKCCLGDYSDFEDAVCARLAGEQSLDWAGCDSSSPAYKYVKENIQTV